MLTMVLLLQHYQGSLSTKEKSAVFYSKIAGFTPLLIIVKYGIEGNS